MNPYNKHNELRGPYSIAQMLQDNFRRLSGMLAAGLVKPIPSTKYDISELDTALRQFSHARHIGKIVVQCARHPAQPSCPRGS